MELSELVKSLEKYPNLTSLEILIAGIITGSTQLSLSILFRFLSESSSSLAYDQKQKFYSFLLQGNLGKAKDLVLSTKSKTLLKKKVPELKNPSVFKCELCKKTIIEDEIEYLENCTDIFHRKCLIAYMEDTIENDSYPIKCPKCNKNLTNLEISTRLSKKFYDFYQRIEIVHAVGPNLNIVECPIVGCHHKIAIGPNQVKFECPICHNLVCFKCKVKFHEGLTCEQFRKSHKPIINCPFCNNEVMVRNKGMLLCKCMMQFCSECFKSPGNCHCVVGSIHFN